MDGHHIRHLADGGETSLGNLVLLCRRHHRLLHEGGFACEKTGCGEVAFTSPADEPLPPIWVLPGVDSGEDRVALVKRYGDTAHIDARTCGTRGLAVSHLM